MVSSFDLNAPPDPQVMLEKMQNVQLLSAFSYVLFFMWLWGIATRLIKKVDGYELLKYKKFKILFFIPALYVPFMFLLNNTNYQSTIARCKI